ncbi:MAG: hypothetical protein ACODAU_04950 [Myxococcota bacterium]
MKQFLPVLLGAVVALYSQTAAAQPAEQRVLELNQQAMEAYMALDVERAKELLFEALRIAERSNLEGLPLARTYVNLGVVAVGGDQDRPSAFEFFKAALTADPTIEPDPATSTPEVDETFELAQGRHQMETGQSPAGEEATGGPAAPGRAEGSPSGEDAAPSDASEEAYDFGQARRVFLHVGFTVGAATAQPGKPADPQPPADCALDGSCSSYVPPRTDDCGGREFCVRVQEPGMLPTFAVTTTLGYYVLPRFALALSVRSAFSGGSDALAGLMAGVRAQYDFVQPQPEGLSLAAFGGASVGQIQVQPDQGGSREPYITSGPGSAQLGGVIGYRFLPGFGLVATPQVHLLFPTFMFAMDLTVGLDLAF